MRSNPIVNSMIPSQRHTVQSIPNPREFSKTDWRQDYTRTYMLDWTNPLQADTNDPNYFDRNEAWKPFKNSMFNPLTGQEPIYGQINYTLNPLNQEQTNSHTVAYAQNGQTRVAWNMNPTGVMRFPNYQYPTRPWQTNYVGSRSK